MISPPILSPVLVTPPTDLPVSLAAAKAHLRVEHDEDDGMIEGLIAAAVSHLDGWTGALGRCLMPQVWRVDLPSFPLCGRIVLPIVPVRSVTITYLDGSGALVGLLEDEFSLRGTRGGMEVWRAPARSWPATAEAPIALSLTLACGWQAADDVPAAIRHAILLMVGDLYRNRETTGVGSGVLGTVPMSLTVDRLLAPWRRGTFT